MGLILFFKVVLLAEGINFLLKIVLYSIVVAIDEIDKLPAVYIGIVVKRVEGVA